MLLPACLLMLACSDDDNSYNADTAITPYEPMPASYRMVKSVKLSTTDKGREYTYEYNFSYDIQNRIKQINGNTKTYITRNNRIYEVNITSAIDYFLTGGNSLKVVYNASEEYPDYPDWNRSIGTTNYGSFNNSGVLQRFGPFDCVYSGITLLKEAHLDNGRKYTIYRDRDNNVTGYQCDSADITLAHKPNSHEYSMIDNKTNIDFSALFGYWDIEREINNNGNWLYAVCQLAAFDMLGTRSRHLPKGEWELNEDKTPKSCTLQPSGIKVTIEYIN